MATPQEVAEWMVKQIEAAPYIYQETIVYKIKIQFGEEFVYTNENGNLAISKDVLKKFRKLASAQIRVCVRKCGCSQKTANKTTTNSKTKGRVK